MIRATLITVGILCLLVAIVVIVGYVLPEEHVVSRETRVEHPPDRVFALLADVEAYPRWRSDVKRVQLLSRASPLRWLERGSNGNITFEIAEYQPPRRLVSRIADPSLAFGGTWTYDLRPDGSGTRVTITERGQVFNPVFRFMSRFVFGHTATLDRFLRDLERRTASSGM
jgi:uncharacterized protein YndB with AHSA1/START domain